MATGTNNAFNHTAKLIGNGVIDFATHTFKIIALNGTPVATNTIKTNITSGTGDIRASNLAAVTKTLASSTPWTTVTTNDARFDQNDVTFTASGGSSTIKSFAVYDENTTVPLDALVCWGDVDTAATAVTLAAGEKLTVTWNANGVIRLLVT